MHKTAYKNVQNAQFLLLLLFLINCMAFNTSFFNIILFERLVALYRMVIFIQQNYKKNRR